MRWRRLMTLEYLTALQGLLRSIVDAEELQQQAEREVQNPGRWGATRAGLLRELGHPEKARAADRLALELTANPAEQAVLQQRIAWT